ncbi:MAG: UDP-N-acetylmuramoyl-L-alanine--D-glutamate ligase [Thermodesulfobacteriota bacterium]
MSETFKGLERGDRLMVMGFGVSGRAALNFGLAMGAEVMVSDNALKEKQTPILLDQLESEGVSCEWGGHSLDFLSRGDVIFVSPGIAWDNSLLEELRSQGKSVLGELELGASMIREKVIGVTGTNGKTTVTRLIGELLRASGKKVFVGGNIGTPLLDYLSGSERADILVLELSSFQLEAVKTFSADIALLLNITPDHLDRHGDMEGYAAAKAKIFGGESKGALAILCGDDPLCRDLASRMKEREVMLFGHDEDCTARVVEATIHLECSGSQEFYEVAGTRLGTRTGCLNSAAALLAARHAGADPAGVRKGLAEFMPDRHRVEFVAEKNGVSYFNDSKATNSGALISGLENFPEKVILIAGGREKGEDFSVLRKTIAEGVKFMVVIGEAADALEKALGDVVETKSAVNLKEALRLAADRGVEGDTVLLSPACSSFDQFTNYQKRGDVFCRLVTELEEV